MDITYSSLLPHRLTFAFHSASHVMCTREGFGLAGRVRRKRCCKRRNVRETARRRFLVIVIIIIILLYSIVLLQILFTSFVLSALWSFSRYHVSRNSRRVHARGCDIVGRQPRTVTTMRVLLPVRFA